MTEERSHLTVEQVQAIIIDASNAVKERDLIIKQLTERAEKAERERDFAHAQIRQQWTEGAARIFKPFDSVDEMKVERMLKVIK